MRKPFLIVTSLILMAILAVIPFIDGYLFKQYYLSVLANISNTSQTRITVQEYHLGWFSSQAKLFVESKIALPREAQKIPVGITFIENISHGPVVHDPIANQWTFARAMIQNHLYLPEPANTMLLGPDNQGFLHIDTLAQFNGKLLNKIFIPVINMQVPGAGKLSWQGLQGNTTVYTDDRIVNRVQSDMNIGAFSVQSMLGDLAMQNTTIRYDLNRLPIGLWDGSYLFSMPDFSYNTPDQKRFSVKNVNINNLFNLKGTNLYSSQLNFSMGKLIIPEYDLDSLNLNLNIKDLDAEGLINFYNNIQQLPQGANLTDAQINQYKDIVMKMMSPSTTISENLTINTSLGNIISDGSFYFATPAKTFEQAQQAASFKLNIRASVACVNKWIELSAPKHDPEAPIVTVPAVSSGTDINQMVSALADQNQISMSASIGLKDLINRHLDVNAFAANIDQMVLRKDITADVASQVKAQYVLAQDMAKTTIPVPVPQQPQLTPVDAAKKQISDWVQQGYIIQNNNDYVVTITREQGVIKVNGLALPG